MPEPGKLRTFKERLEAAGRLRRAELPPQDKRRNRLIGLALLLVLLVIVAGAAVVLRRDPDDAWWLAAPLLLLFGIGIWMAGLRRRNFGKWARVFDEEMQIRYARWIRDRMKPIRLSAATPRRLADIRQQLDLHKGLYTGYFAGGLMAICGLAVELHLFRVARPAALELLLGLQLVILPVFGVSLLILLRTYRRYRQRVDAFVNGRLMTARVIRHRLAYRPWMLPTAYVITAEATFEDGHTVTGSLRTIHQALARFLPVGTELQALCVRQTGTLFTPVEIDADLEIG